MFISRTEVYSLATAIRTGTTGRSAPSLQEWTGDTHKLPYSGPDIRVQPIKASMQNLNIPSSEITISLKV